LDIKQTSDSIINTRLSELATVSSLWKIDDSFSASYWFNIRTGHEKVLFWVDSRLIL